MLSEQISRTEERKLGVLTDWLTACLSFPDCLEWLSVYRAELPNNHCDSEWLWSDLLTLLMLMVERLLGPISCQLAILLETMNDSLCPALSSFILWNRNIWQQMKVCFSVSSAGCRSVYISVMFVTLWLVRCSRVVTGVTGCLCDNKIFLNKLNLFLYSRAADASSPHTDTDILW